MAEATQHTSSSRSSEISPALQTGVIALRWPEEPRKSPGNNRKGKCPVFTQLSIDSKGFYLICYDKTKNEIECLDLALIHDTRTGSEVSLPLGVECLDEISFGLPGVSLASKWVTIYYGNTFVVSEELRVIHFCFHSPTIAQEWTARLFQYGHDQHLKNLSSLECLKKIHSKIVNGLIDSNKIIPVQNLIHFLCRNNREANKETRIHQALEHAKLPSHSSSMINSHEFTFERFFRFYMHLMDRGEIENLFYSISGKHRRYISWENLKAFLRRQNDPYNDSFGIDYYEQKAKDLIRKCAHHAEDAREKGMSEESFLWYLLSSDNLIVDPKISTLHMDMTKPLSHYFIASSHNTYLSGSQLTGRASVEMYRQVLLTGCRCIELDVVDSENDEPEIKHIHTPVKPVLFIEVIVAIRDYGFKVNSYPIILSIENHCRPKGQAKMARSLIDVFGERLLTKPLSTHPCDENCPLPSPNDLRNKVLIKNKKLESSNPTPTDPVIHKMLVRPDPISNTSSSGQMNSDRRVDPVASRPLSPAESETDSDQLGAKDHRITPLSQKNPHEGVLFEEAYFSDNDEISDPTELSIKTPESKATSAMSDLVCYTVPVRFKSFAQAEERNRSFEMSSFPEDRAQSLIRDHAKDFLAYNQRQLSRIYPRGTRFESSNYNPYTFWPIGCQMVALNYQTLDLPMQLNLGLFSFNGACGYIEKPSAICRSRSSFDPRVQTNVENVVSYQLDLKVLSGQFLCQVREPTFVDIQMYGMYGQINKRYEYRLRAKKWNGFHAIYDDTDVESGEFSIQFSKVILPEIAALHFSVTAEDGGLIGQSFIPIAHLRPGYRHIVLRNQINIPVNFSSLFIFIRRNIYINEKDQEFADKLVQPLITQYSKSSCEINQRENNSSNVFIRHHHLSVNHSEAFSKTETSSISTDQSNSYLKHAIAGSELNDKKRLCKIIPLNDIHRDEVSKRDKIIQNKLRSLSADHQPRIKKEEERFDHQYSHQNLQTNHRPTSAMNRRDMEQSLLKLYSEKFHQQEELECKHLNEYYKRLEKEITDDYTKQLKQIQTILKKEKVRVYEQVRLKIKSEGNEIMKNKANRDQISTLKARSSEKNIKIGETTLQMLEEMSEQATGMLEINLQINRFQLEEERAKEMKICLKRYSDGLNKIKLQLQSENETGPSPSYPSRRGTASTPTAPHHPADVLTLNRRQTIGE